MIIEQSDFTPKALQQALEPLIANRQLLLDMSMRARAKSTPMAAKRVAEVIIQEAN